MQITLHVVAMLFTFIAFFLTIIDNPKMSSIASIFTTVLLWTYILLYVR